VEIVEANTGLNDTPDLVNREPYAGAWMIRVKLKNPAEAAQLLDAAAYSATL
jgi:glycine cleavage system H protein